MRLSSAMAGAVLGAALLLAAGRQAALAGGAPGGTNLYGNVTCGQSYSASCAVSAGSGPAAGTPGSGAGAPARPGTAGGSGGAPAGCRNTAARLACPGAADAMFGTGAGALPAPAALAELAREYLVLPSPVIRSSPAQAGLQLVQLPTWLWISPAEWAARSKTATVPGESVTATATPVEVTWHPGDRSTVTCRGPGTPYTSADDPASASPDCGHTYASSSAGQPGGAYTATVTITWDIAWHGAGGAGGVLPPLFTTAVAAFRVAESQALDTSGGA